MWPPYRRGRPHGAAPTQERQDSGDLRLDSPPVQFGLVDVEAEARTIHGRGEPVLYHEAWGAQDLLAPGQRVLVAFEVFAVGQRVEQMQRGGEADRGAVVLAGEGQVAHLRVVRDLARFG